MNSTAKTQRFLITSALDQLPVQRRYLYIFTYLASLTALQILNLALDSMSSNLWLCGALTGGFVFSYFVEPRYRAITTFGVSALALIVFPYYLWKYMEATFMFGAYLGALLGVLMVLLSYKAFAPNDHRFILMIGVVFLLFSSAACYDLKFMLEMPLFLVFAGCSLYISSQVDVAVRVSQTTGTPVDDRIELGRSFVSVLARAISGIVGLSIVAYILAPHGMRQDRPLHLTPPPQVAPENAAEDAAKGGPSKQHPTKDEANIGIGDDFKLTDGSRLTADSTPVLEMKSHRNGYLRAQVFDVYTGSGWTRSQGMARAQGLQSHSNYGDPDDGSNVVHTGTDAGAQRLVPLIDFPSEAVLRRLEKRDNAAIDLDSNVFSTDSSLDLDHEIIRQEVRLLKSQPPYYFSMYQPMRVLNLAVDKHGNLLDEPLVDRGSTLRPDDTERWHPEGFGYTIESIELRARVPDLELVVLPGPEKIVKPNTLVWSEDSPALSPGEMSAYGFTETDFRPISRKMRNFAVSLVDRAAGAQPDKPLGTWDKVMAIYNFVSDPKEFTYSREYQDIDPSGEATESFIFGTRQGYCRQFASAMAVMCRLNNIPARVVTGFAPGSRSLIDNAWVYKSSNAHAWVEVYFDGYGWILFDPTPESKDPHNQPPAAEFLRSTVDFLQELFVLDPAGTQQTIIGGLKEFWAYMLRHLLISLSLLLGLSLVIGGVLLWRALPHNRRSAPLQADNEVVAAWFFAANQLSRLGLGPQEGSTARSLSHSATARLEELHEQVDLLLPMYEQAAYSRRKPEAQTNQEAWTLAKQIQTLVSLELERLRQQKRGKS